MLNGLGGRVHRVGKARGCHSDECLGEMTKPLDCLVVRVQANPTNIEYLIHCPREAGDVVRC